MVTARIISGFYFDEMIITPRIQWLENIFFCFATSLPDSSS